ncbi:MAG: hypothetical protein DMG06_23840 [Acidobacteria bacterium]|nr:MAG: hypothetical protein DMG06_23840 [Acidobacteriota bacterium]
MVNWCGQINLVRDFRNTLTYFTRDGTFFYSPSGKETLRCKISRIPKRSKNAVIENVQTPEKYVNAFHFHSCLHSWMKFLQTSGTEMEGIS